MRSFFLPSVVVLLLYALYFSPVSTGNVLLENTGFRCNKQSDCIALLGSGWCKYSTILCYSHQCRVSPLRACLPFESGNTSSPCLKRNHRCEVKPCNTDSNCGDEDGNRQFCDGYDKCINGLCQFYFITNNCARQNTRCIKRENICSPPFRTITTDPPAITTTVINPRIIIIQDTNSSNTTGAPTLAPPVNFWLWWIVLFAIFGGVTLFVVIVATLTRNAPPTIVPNNRGGVAYYY